MAKIVIDWRFSAGGVSNQNESHAAIVFGATEVTGPGVTD